MFKVLSVLGKKQTLGFCHVVFYTPSTTMLGKHGFQVTDVLVYLRL
jgi:hypothetical protein